MDRAGKVLFIVAALAVLCIAILNLLAASSSYYTISASVLTIVVAPGLIMILLWIFVGRSDQARFDAYLAREGSLVTKREMDQRRAAELGVPYVELDRVKPDPSAIEGLQVEFLRDHQALPIKKAADCLWVAMADINDIKTQDLIRHFTGCKVIPVICDDTHLERTLRDLGDKQGEEQ